MAKLSQDTRDRIKNDPELFSYVCQITGLKPVSLPAMLDRNSSTLNEYSIIKMIACYLKKHPDKIVDEEISEVKEARK
jgi:hypothetical protein